MVIICTVIFNIKALYYAHLLQICVLRTALAISLITVNQAVRVLDTWNVLREVGVQFKKRCLTLRLLMSYIYIYGAPILDVSRSHTTTQHSR